MIEFVHFVWELFMPFMFTVVIFALVLTGVALCIFFCVDALVSRIQESFWCWADYSERRYKMFKENCIARMEREQEEKKERLKNGM